MDLSERSILFNERATIPQGYNIRIKDALNEIKSGKYENPNGVIKMIIRKVELNKGNGNKYVYIPKKIDIKEGDYVKIFKVKDSEC